MGSPAPVENAHRCTNNMGDARHPLVSSVARLLQATVAHNEQKNRSSSPELNSFEGPQPLEICISSYVERLIKYGGFSPSCLAIGMIYIERLQPKVKDVWLTSRNIQRLFLVAVMEAVKFWEDFCYSNSHWAVLGELPVAEINQLELEFLSLTNFKLCVSKEQYERMASAIMKWRPSPSPSPSPAIAAAKITAGRDGAVHSLAAQVSKQLQTNPDLQKMWTQLLLAKMRCKLKPALPCARHRHSEVQMLLRAYSKVMARSKLAQDDTGAAPELSNCYQ
mmetsp:Transcript_23388/g.46951  ORF Transcript_23388/g.46951 Transcript_23388/m.46951 type:complete len:278 (-) Transcript_23388:27-860(-)